MKTKLNGQSKPSRRLTTGTEMKLFLGLDYESEGFMHIKPPRNCTEYEDMKVSQICRRIQDDIEELVARAYPNYGEEWAKKFAPGWWRYRYEGFSPFVTITETLANQLRAGLWEQIKSNDNNTSNKAHKEFLELLQKRTVAEPTHAARSLAFVTRQAATWLENLSVKRPTLIQEVAKESPLWPVNLGIGQKVRKGKNGKRSIQTVITRMNFAEKYLKKLGVNTNSTWLESSYSGAKPKSPFRFASESLYQDLLLMKQDPKFYFPKLTPWAKKLIALAEPMTTANADAWWRVAKGWLDEQWEVNHDCFKPLIASCKHDGKPLKEAPLFGSEVKSHIIDLRLKETFLALAKLANL